ncbi:MAG: hypothetical protein R3219_07650 [Hydrogenovibrio sp.]|nr:hypothetical protein [Hydrogenovibrio sp.]
MDEEVLTLEPLEEAQQGTPSAEQMLARLEAVDIDTLDVQTITDELKGDQAWLFVLTMPISAIVLAVFTLLGTFLTGYFIVSFLVTAGIVFLIGQMINQYEQKFRREARLEAINRIAAYEGEEGLIPHFHDFLPDKYRHLWQSLRKKNFIYVEQYIAAVRLLQGKLDHEKFTHIWHLKHPETDPENQEPSDEEEFQHAR